MSAANDSFDRRGKTDAAAWDWRRLEALRDRFLAREGAREASEDYWRSAADLELYDRFFAERIGWKWRAVVRELEMRGLSGRLIGAGAAAKESSSAKPPTILDFACGTGIAARVVAPFIGPCEVIFYDRSRSAAEYAKRRFQAAVPGVPAAVHAREPETAPDILLVSHALNELDDDAFGRLTALARRAAATIIVEPGSIDASHRLGRFRERLLEAHEILAPCPMSGACPVLKDRPVAGDPAAEGETPDWCHFFALPDAEVHRSRDWAFFSQKLEIDIRSLPYSFIATRRNDSTGSAACAGGYRMVGRPSFSKVGARFQACAGDALVMLEARKREVAPLVKRLTHGPMPLYLPKDRVVEGRVQSEPS